MTTLLRLCFSTLLLSFIACQSSSSKPAVATSVPISGDYNGPKRPQIHFSPPRGFMNDPNGMFKDPDGVFHLYYQYNPTDLVAGNQHWGHATSRDLYHWKNEPIALFPEEGEGIFSGSAIIDTNNTSGFFPNQTNGVVAIYTLNNDQEQRQDIAYSFDNGYTFTKYSDNPVLSINGNQFRDPKVIWHSETSKWVMAVAYAHDFAIGIFTSPDLKSWTHASNFSHAGLLGLQYECPNLVRMLFLKDPTADDLLNPSNFAPESGQMWLMLISINPGAPLGGSIAQYFPGSFNGTHFAAADNAARIADWAKDNYAGQFFYGVPGDEPQISIAWASNWQYTNVVPTASEGWRSTMSLPRYNVLANTTQIGYNMLSIPYPLDSLHTTSLPLASNDTLANGSMIFDYEAMVPSGALSFTLSAAGLPEPPISLTGSLNFTLLSSATGEMLRGGFLLSGDSTFFLDRSGTHGYTGNPLFTSQFSTAHPVDPATNAFKMHVVVDRSIIEVFLDNGQRSATAVYFTEGELDILVLGSLDLNDGVTVKGEVWGLKSAWIDEQQGSNVTQVTSNGWGRFKM